MDIQSMKFAAKEPDSKLGRSNYVALIIKCLDSDDVVEISNLVILCSRSLSVLIQYLCPSLSSSYHIEYQERILARFSGS